MPYKHSQFLDSNNSTKNVKKICWLCIIFFVLFFCNTSPAQASVIVNIPTGHNYATGGLLIGSKLYLPVTNSNVGIDVINTTTNTLIKTIAAGASFDGYYTSGILVGTKIYIGTYSSDGIDIYDTTTDTFVSRINTGNSYFNSGYFDNDKLYIPNAYSSSIDIVDTTSDTLTISSPISTGNNYYSSSAESGYVLGINGLDIIDSSTDTVTQVATGHGGYAGITSLGSKLYIPTDGYGVDIVDVSSSYYTTNMSHIDNAYQGSATLIGSKLYIPVSNSGNGGGVDIYDTATDVFEENISTGGTYTSTGVLIGDNLYIPRSTGGVDFINTADNNTVTNISTGRTYNNVKITQVGEKIFIPSSSGNSGVDIILPDPVIPDDPSSAPSLDAGSDTGVSNSDNITNDDTPRFNVTCTEAGNTIKLYIDGSQTDSHTCVGSGGTESVDVASPLADGTYSITYTESNDGGESGESPSLSITVDITAPSSLSIVSVGGDTSSPYSTTDATPNIVISTEVDDIVTISGFSCSPTPATGSSVTCTKDSPDYTVGSHSVSPTVTDTAGNSTSGSVSFSITTTTTTSPSNPSSTPRAGYTSYSYSVSNSNFNSQNSSPITNPPAPNTTEESKDSICERYLQSYIAFGQNNNPEDVKKLESFLNQSEGENLVVDGVYGTEDVLAVRRFQTKYSDQILSPWGLSNSTGNVFRTTTAKINLMVCSKKTTCPYFSKYLKPGDYDSEVVKVQDFLNILADPTGQYTNKTIPLSPYFNPATVQAVKNYQTIYKKIVLDPWGLQTATGFWYQTTRYASNKLIGCQEEAIHLNNGSVINY